MVSDQQSPVTRFVLIDGEPVPYQEAVIHVDDRGLQFGESVYEVIAYYNGRPFRLPAHLDRLSASATAVGLDIPPRKTFAEWLENAVSISELTEGSIYIQVTGGVLPRRHVPRTSPRSTVLIVAQVGGLPELGHADQTGIRCKTVPDDRWARCNIKTTGLLPNILARREAIADGFDDALFVRDGFVTEGPSNNVFLVQAGDLLTPPANNYILRGITRDALIELAGQLSIHVKEEPVRLRSISQALEAFVCSTVMNIRPVVEIDSHKLASTAPGSVTSRLQEALSQLIREETAG